MATIKTIQRASGKTAYQIVFRLDKKYKYLSLGSAYSRREAETIALLVDRIADSVRTDEKLDRRTTAWLQEASDDLRARLEKVGLIRVERETTLNDVFDAYWENEFYNLKPCTQGNKRQSKRRLFEYFDGDAAVSSITRQAAQAFVDELDKRVSQATRAGIVRDVRRVFNWAKHAGLVERNPFDGIVRGSFKNKSREYYISMDDYEKLLDACPSQMWRVVIALYRIGGLRKEEALRVEWRDIDFPRGRLLVHSPKTERYEGKASRVVPLFPELRAELEKLWDEVPEGCSPYVIDRNRTTIGKHIERIVFMAGLNRWERLIQNFRSSRAIEIYEQYGEMAESEWIGHSPSTAKAHYLHVLDATFERAVCEGTKVTNTAKDATNKTTNIVDENAEKSGIIKEKSAEPQTVPHS